MSALSRSAKALKSISALSMARGARALKSMSALLG